MISKRGQDCPLDGAEPAMLYCALDADVVEWQTPGT